MAPQTPAQMLVQHLVALQSYEQGLRNRVRSLLRAAMREIVQELTTKYRDLTPFQAARLQTALRQFEGILQRSYKEVVTLTSKESATLALLEGRFSSTLIAQVVQSAGAAVNAATLTQKQLKAIANFPVNGATAGEWWATQGANAAFQVRRNIQLGMMRGETTPQIASRLLQSRGSEVGGVASLIENNAATLVRTSVNAISTAARFETFSTQDPDLTDSYQYVATLDDRTTIICASLDGQVFKYDDATAPRPPMHPNCRSTIVPVIKWQELGVRPPEDFMALQRASMDGPTSYQTYSSWLRNQPATIQNDVLGPTRAGLFRNGDASLRDLVGKTDQVLTLPQLAQKLGIKVDDM